MIAEVYFGRHCWAGFVEDEFSVTVGMELLGLEVPLVERRL